MRRCAFILGVAIMLLAAEARAQEKFCAGVAFSDALNIGQIKADAEKVFFRKNGDRKNLCPSPDPRCQDKAWLVAGDLVALGRKSGDFVCVDYDNGVGDRTGWLPAEKIEPAPLATDPELWIGPWKRVEADITIEKTRDGLKAQGDATFGALDPERVKRGAVHSGAFFGPLVLKDGQATLVDSSDISACSLRMARSGDFLFVRDNRNCGGLNVSFSGLYLREGK